LTFDIAQFFSSLNHWILHLILEKAGFNLKVLSFFKNYLIGRKTMYLWNNFSSPLCNVDIGVGQSFALSLILSALYLSLIFHILEKQLHSLKIPISILSFVDNGLFISQHKSIFISNMNLFCSYNIVSTLLTKFSLVMEHSKTEVFTFLGSKEILTLLLWILLCLEALSSIPTIPGIISASSLIKTIVQTSH